MRDAFIVNVCVEGMMGTIFAELWGEIAAFMRQKEKNGEMWW